jgi:hypothetical protein
MKTLDVPLKNEVAPKGIVSFELAGSLQNSIDILNSWDANAKLYAGLSLGFDYLFMLMYSLLLFVLIKYITSKFTKKSVVKFGNFLAIAMLLAGIFDAIENYSLIQLYLGNLEQIFSTVAYYSANLKFSLIGIGLLYIIIGYSYFSRIKFMKKKP